MKYKTHLTTSLAVALPVLASTGNLTVGNVIAVSFGALLPDIDEQHSWIGRRTRGVSDLMNTIFGHRGITHSLLGLVLVLIPILFAVSMTPLSFTNGMCIFAGYFLHLVEDSFSKKGVKWLLPVSNKKFQSGFNIIYYSYNGIAEKVILMTSTIVVIYELYSYGITSFQSGTSGIIEAFKSLFG
ncbi:metal-dependent hydrolase [Bacillus cytotoxicus]|uniref:metal-dependent hydrolase n=1 Tax=Bacillus cereus group TaxID=86661 RepID=UPI000B96410B|nr:MULTISPECIES: metal-dependent hydrolase [Bacillus cereus group]AWC30963.1 metal-dependent hydrolase [Bacillus cytotoxicus]AWC35086.1 metal-dependent hydrolase [Bacillus cytotoxicus]AWC39052.1 metal-dependent hydrolase [Bacillus cytotoxicus]AWC43055.1 metal-dependent hydrolase [Bacillus cytotoxicus]AWC46955.1 metal-dependent hydrolase [Bacillus cytotoxicus]